MELKRKQGEQISSFLYRFSKKIQQSGILREAKKRRHKDRSTSKRQKRLSAIYRVKKKKEVEKAKKMGTL
ncbi:MAG TPA: 30S ribosomal protein S21 [Candidatus Wolfebacteria bacterium]|nr:30S ribosomal protein S21 [Candidatus Wolfebacteria bacterium]